MDFINKIESIFLNPYLRSILILIILAGIYFELQTPGVGFPLLAAAVAALLYFVPSYLHGFAQNWEILIFLLGLGLVVLEIFVIPGFGMAGISGIILIVGGLLLVMLQNDLFDFSLVSFSSFMEAIAVLLIGIFGGAILLFASAGRIINSKAFKKITLQDRLDTKEGYTSTFFTEPMVGKTGVAYTVLRPSGKVMIDDVIYDAFSRNDFIEKGDEIIVIEESTTSLKVKKKGS
jgi:membrane-bound serine protease (ClpP class)